MNKRDKFSCLTAFTLYWPFRETELNQEIKSLHRVASFVKENKKSGSKRLEKNHELGWAIKALQNVFELNSEGGGTCHSKIWDEYSGQREPASAKALGRQ